MITNFILSVMAMFTMGMNWIFIPAPVSSAFSQGSFSPDDVGEYITVPFHASLVDRDNYTAMCWVKAAGAQATSAVIAQMGGTSASTHRAWALGTGESGRGEDDNLRVYICETGGNCGGFSNKIHIANDLGETFDNTDWHHVGFTWNSGTVKLYVDGVESTSPTLQQNGSFTQLNDVTSEGVRISASFGTGNGYKSNIDDCAVFPGTTLSAANFATIYNSGTPNDVTASFFPSGYWLFESDSDTTASGIVDAAGANNGSCSAGCEADDVNDPEVP